ncbi:MAG: DUF5020 family protein [Fidelibacterota bacterium]
MKKRFVLCSLLIWIGLSGQNLQLHYDFGENRGYLTSTLEMFRPDDFGATFWFVDIDYDDGSGTSSASLAYWEIARYVALPFLKNSPSLNRLTATVQYNDGLTTLGGFGSVWLGGFSYPVNLNIITLNTDLLYRHAEKQPGSFQLTLVWVKTFCNDKLVFSGFMDLWGQENFDGDTDSTDKQLVLLSEPQLWFNVTKHLALGGEVEISRNFIYAAGAAWKFMPTLGLKWEF